MKKNKTKTIESMHCWNNGRSFDLIIDNNGIFWSGWDLDPMYSYTWKRTASNLGSDAKKARKLHKVEKDKINARINEAPSAFW